MTENAVSPKPSFVSSILPWLIAAAALAVYLITLNPWISLNSLIDVSRISGWTWQPSLSGPLYWLFTYPCHWLPVKSVPVALNLLSVVCAVLTLALLARSVALLPHDRTHEQRQRETSPFSLLSVPAAWLPPVLAALVCGLELTFWENATAGSTEMLNLLLFAYVIRCLLEFRIDERESWLTRAAFVYALGMANNWAMIGFFPLFLAALVWIRGLSFFNLGFLGRMFLFGMLGLLLYLWLPIVQSRAEIAPVQFWQALRSNLGNQEGLLVMIYKNGRQTIALLALSSLVPIFIIGIKWASYFGDTSKLGVALATIMFHVVHALFLVACVWVALDPPFSPRSMGFGVPFLTFYYLGALAVGYFSGYFLLVFRAIDERSRRKSGYLSLIHGAAVCALWLLLFLAPLAMVSRNLPQIRATNGPMLKEMGRFLIEGLPPKGAIALSDDPKRLFLAQAAAAQSGREAALMFVDTGSLQFSQYHQFLKKRYGTRWLGESPQGPARRVDPLAILPLIASLQRSNAVYYLHPSFGYYFDFFYLEPHGLVYELFPYPSNSPFPPPPAKELLAENESFWSRADAQAIEPLLSALAPPSRRANPGLMERFTNLAHLKREPNREASVLGQFYSRALDYFAVDLQKRGELDKAAARFARALELNPDNIAALASFECNKKLREGAPTPVKNPKAVEDSFGSKYRDWNHVIGENGPFDEPTFCYAHAQVLVQSKLLRQAMQQFERVREFDPNHLGARLWLAQLYVMVQKPDDALRIAREIHQNETGFGLNRTNLTELLVAEASAHLARKDVPAAQAAIDKTLEQFAAEKEMRAALFAMATQIYLNFGYFTNALECTDQQLQLSPDNPGALVNKGYAYLQLGAFDLAIPPLTRVIELQSTNYSALLNRAIAYLRGGKLDEAQQDYEALQKAVPLSFSIFYGLGEIAYRRKDTNAAIYNYELYLANAPRNPQEIKFVTTRLEELKKGPPLTGRMRVTHVITRLIVGGAQENTIASVLGLREKPGFQVNLLSGPTAGPEGSLEPLLGGAPDLLRIIPELVRPVHPWKDSLALRRLTAIFRSDRPDIVHTHSGKAGLLGRLAAFRAGVPIILHTIHGPSFGAFQGAFSNSVFRSAERRAARVTTHFVVVAEAMKQQYLAAGIGQPEQYTKILSGFAIEPFLSAKNDFALRARWGLAADDVVIGKIARLFKLKGHDALFAIAPELVRTCPKIRFLLVGDGPWRGRLEDQARALGLERHFVFTGLVPPSVVPQLVGLMDILVHLSSREGLARALPQALAAAKPVVAFDCDGAREVCLEGQTGFLVMPGDSSSLSEHLLRLARDPALRERLGRQGPQFVRERFSVEAMVDDLHKLYLRLGRVRMRDP